MDKGARELLKRFMSTSTCGSRCAISAPPSSRWWRSPGCVFEARLVIMVEPTSSLDEHEVKVLFETIRS
jgi:hypothetical protein